MVIQKGHFGPKGVAHALLKSLTACYSLFPSWQMQASVNWSSVCMGVCISVPIVCEFVHTWIFTWTCELNFSRLLK